MILVFGLVVGLWEALAGGLLPPSIGEEQCLGLEEEQQQKCDHCDQNLIIGYHSLNRISQLISGHLTGLYHNYFVIIFLEKFLSYV